MASGQVVLLSGEAGIGESRLVRVLTERVMEESAPRVTFRCSPYHTNSALSPVLEHLQQLLHFHREDEAQTRLRQAGTGDRGVWFAPCGGRAALCCSAVRAAAGAVCSPAPESGAAEAEDSGDVGALAAPGGQWQPVLTVWEDLHWADPSTLELLSLTLDQTPTARLLHLLTCRPSFSRLDTAHLSLGAAHLLAGHLEEARALAERALALACERQERSEQAYALRLLGDIATRHEPPDTDRPKPLSARPRPGRELGMRPLQAHCHLGLGTLYAKSGRPDRPTPRCLPPSHSTAPWA